MSLLVDRPRWPWRGEYWSHLVSDSSLAELHEFASVLGVRRLAFQGDHYDLPRTLLPRALEQGATLVDSRTLVRRLRTSGLRHRQPMGWHRHLQWSDDDRSSLDVARARAGPLPHPISTDIDALAHAHRIRAVVVLRRPSEWGVGVTTIDQADESVLDGETRRWPVTEGELHHLDWLVPLAPATGG